MSEEYKPYVDAKTDLKELTWPPLVLGAIMAVVLGAANTYLGLRAGMTVAATFPAAVLSMAVLRLFKGNILEENISRTTGAVGEALAAGAIFTIPAFVMVGAWDNLDLFSGYWFLATALLLVGGILGVLIMILLRRTFMEDTSLPFPESQACTEIVKAGQGGQTGAGSVFAAMGLAGLIELLKNSNGIPIIGGHHKGAFKLGEDSNGAFPFFTPEPSPAFLAVGYIIGPKYGAIIAAGGLFGWMLLMPILLYIMAGNDPQFATNLNEIVAQGDWGTLFGGGQKFSGLSSIYSKNIKMIAIGAMIVGAFYTLFMMRDNLITGIGRSVKSLGGGGGGKLIRTDKDLNIKGVFAAIGLMALAMLGLYVVLCGSITISIIMTIVMVIMAFLFAAVAGFLVSIIGSSSNPISGLTLSTLLISAGLLVLLGMGGGYMDDGTTMSEAMKSGVIAVLGVATVVCCVAGVAGDMAQDWKVGYNLGGTPWRMEVGGFIGVIAAALCLVSTISLLHNAYPGGIGGEELSAPQAGLMAVTAKGIISGTLPWELILMGMLFAVGLICVGVPSPMLVAVGMYLPFFTIMAIFTGGVIQWIGNIIVNKQGTISDKQREEVSNRGLLVASGFVAGEALMALILAALVGAKLKLFATSEAIPKLEGDGFNVLATAPEWFGLKPLGGLIIIFLAFYIISSSLKALKANK
ncbi:MAG: oligopeptide transporter, OPT family [Deltaproteobacteria bacterium]|nr:oligopeptide transporter, OPT family [Deltaproteobacteria bacterium]